MRHLARITIPVLLAGLPFAASAGFGFGFSDNGFNTWDPEDYPYGYPPDGYNKGWDREYRRFYPPRRPTGGRQGDSSRDKGNPSSGDDWGSSWDRDGWTSSWGSDEPKRLKFGTGKFDFGNNSWSPHFGKSWGRGRAYPPPPPYGYYPPAPGWGGYPPPPAWGGYAAPQVAPVPAPTPAAPAAESAGAAGEDSAVGGPSRAEESK